jgi:hypothetical protein
MLYRHLGRLGAALMLAVTLLASGCAWCRDDCCCRRTLLPRMRPACASPCCCETPCCAPSSCCSSSLPGPPYPH